MIKFKTFRGKERLNNPDMSMALQDKRLFRVHTIIQHRANPYGFTTLLGIFSPSGHSGIEIPFILYSMYFHFFHLVGRQKYKCGLAWECFWVCEHHTSFLTIPWLLSH